MLIDEARIKVIAGKGGDGLISFRREKFVPKGGPDGGDGGRGGDVIFKVSLETHGLEEFRRKKVFKAEDGQDGMRQKKKGKDGESLFLPVPPGTVIYEIVGKRKFLLKDLKSEKETYVVARGGRGGFGNYHFATAVRQAPTFAKPGEEGEEKELFLELRMIADVGLIGLPNVGKSSFLASISSAKPKIADYPFTTLEPVLGVVDYKGKRFIVADIPGLINGASKGKGLGDKFLQHIKRTHLLIFILSTESENPTADYHILEDELSLFDASLLNKKRLLALSKIDLFSKEEIEKKLNMIKEELKIEKIFPFSAVTKEGVENLLNEIIKSL